MYKKITVLLALIFLMTACGGGGDEVGTEERGSDQTDTAVSADDPTAEPTNEPDPTATSKPEPTATSEPEPTDEPAPEPEEVAGGNVDSDWLWYGIAEDGYYLALPPEWREIDMDPETMNASLDALEQENSDVATLLSNAQVENLIISGISFYGFDLSPQAIGDEFPTSINVLKQPLGAEISLDVYTELNVGALENLDNVSTAVDNQRVDVDFGHLFSEQPGKFRDPDDCIDQRASIFRSLTAHIVQQRGYFETKNQVMRVPGGNRAHGHRAIGQDLHQQAAGGYHDHRSVTGVVKGPDGDFDAGVDHS